MLFNFAYTFALIALSPVVIYRMVRHGRYRRGLGQKLFGLSMARAKRLRGDGPCFWIHAVSVGEVNLLGGLVDQLKRTRPDVSIVISSSTDTGYDLAVQRFGVQRVFFCPLDFTWAAVRTIRGLAPERLILVELELWPNLIRIASESGSQVCVVNARMSERSGSRYAGFRRLLGPTFARLDWVGCQDAATRDRFQACGTSADRLSVTGSLKFDNAPTSRDCLDVQRLSEWAGIDPWHRVWVVGSTQSGEESMAVEVYQTLRGEHPELRLVLVPRHRERFDEVAGLIEASGLKVRRRSEAAAIDGQWDTDTVILVDTIGELRSWWGVGPIATVGGSFGDRGGQNMLEPAGYGSAISFGPNTRNFKQIAVALIDAGGAVRVSDKTELTAFVDRCLSDASAADALGRCATEVVAAHRGATERTVKRLAGPVRSQSVRAAA